MPSLSTVYVQCPVRPDVSQARNLNQASRNPKGAGRWGPAPQPPAVAQVFWAYAPPHNASRDPAIFKVGFLADPRHFSSLLLHWEKGSKSPADLTTRRPSMHVMTHTSRDSMCDVPRCRLSLSVQYPTSSSSGTHQSTHVLKPVFGCEYQP